MGPEPAEEEENSLHAFQDLLRGWEEEQARAAHDPTAILHGMAEILEKETNAFIASDPDPFEERHPSRVDASCQLGILLKAFFKKEALVQALINKYLKENFFTRSGQDKSSFDLNVASARMLLDIMPGLEISTLHEADGLTNQLYKWVEAAEEPLRTYATGILAVTMELQEFATEPEIREKNAKLVPELLKRLKEMQQIGEEERDKARSDTFRRPFALFAKSPVKRRASTELLNGGPAAPTAAVNKFVNEGGSNDRLAARPKPPLNRSLLNPGWPAGLKSPTYSSEASRENSNSSWAEMELNIIGHFDIFPINLQTQQIFIFRLLTPLAEYQDFLPLAQGSQILAMLKKYIRVKETGDARLGFEALRLLASLFCHKKYTLEWVYTESLDLLMEMPRPSIAATGSSLCIYYLACDDDTMERICGMPQQTLERLVKYCLWLLECSHDTGKQYAVMFFGLAFQYRVILSIFDKQDGLRKLFNSLSTLKVLAQEEERNELTDDEIFLQRQNVRYTLHTLKQYVETHLALRYEVEITGVMEKDGCSPEPPRPVHRPYRLTPDQITEYIRTLLNLMHYRARWQPIEKLVWLGAPSLLLHVIVLSYDWSSGGREDTVRSALDILAVCAILPRVQMSLCENVSFPGEKTKGINIIMACAEGEVVLDPVVQKAALLLLCHLLGGPIVRPGCSRINGDRGTPGGRRKLSDEVITTVWDSFRANNGIMSLLQLIQTRVPATDADAIRALACQALVGLARSPTATQIMSKLPIFNNGSLTMLVREPVLPDNKGEHLKFQKYAYELLEKVSGPASLRKSYVTTEHNPQQEVSLDMLHRASVVANTKIRFKNKQLYQLIHEHLLLSGLKKSAEALRKEADFIPLVAEGSCPAVYPPCATITSTTVPLPSVRRIILSPPPRLGPSSSRSATPISTGRPGRSSNSSSSNSAAPATPVTPSATATPRSNLPSSLSIRITRTSRSTPAPAVAPFTGTSSTFLTPASTSKQTDPQGQPRALAADLGEPERRVTLTSLVSDYLSSKHALCKNPMTTCPEFDLFLPHRCPDKRSKRSAPFNLAARLGARSVFPRQLDAAKLDRRFIYSRFRPVKSFRAGGEDRESNVFTCTAFSGNDGQFILAGTSMGDLKMFNTISGDETTYQVHDSYVYHVQPSRDNRFVITSSSWRSPFSKVWAMGEFFEEKYEFKDEEYLEFSKLTQDKVIGTRAEGVATIYDINTGHQIRSLKPRYSNDYSHNRACFDPSDELVLSDGVLWDVRVGREIHKLDKLNQTLSGVFHPGGLEIISNTEVWDIRTFHLLRTVPQLEQCQVVFNNTGTIIYGLHLEQEVDDETKFETSFKTFEASDYSSIATTETKKSVLGLCPSWDDLTLAVVEQSPTNQDLLESVVRLYEVGRSRDAEEDQEEEEEDDEEQEEEEDDGDDGDDLSDDDDMADILDGDDDILFESNSSRSGSEEENDGNGEDEDGEEEEEDDNDDDNENNDDDDNGSWEDLEVEERIGDGSDDDNEG